MSPAAAGAQSPITSQNPNPNVHFNHSQNSDTNDFTFNFNCSFSTKAGSEKANLVGRKPRLVKLRKKLGSENGKAKQFDSTNSDSISNRVSEANFDTASDSIPHGDSKINKNVKFNKFDGNLEFRLQKSDSNSGSNSEFGKFDNLGFENRVNKSSVMPNSNVEDVDFMFGANKGSSKLNSNIKNVSFVFGGNKGSSKLDLNMENGGFMSGANKGSSKSVLNADSAGFVFEASKSSSKLKLNVENGGFVFRANEGSSKLDSNVENGGFVVGGNKDSSKLNSHVGNDSFVFGANKGSSKLDLNVGTVGFGFEDNKGSSKLDLNVGNVGFGFEDNKGSSKLDSNMENGVFVFGGNKCGMSQKMGLDEGDIGFGAEKSKTAENRGRLSPGSQHSDLGMNSNFDPRESAGNLGQSGTDEYKKYGFEGFVFGVKNGPHYAAKQSAFASDESILRKDTQGESAGEPGGVECGKSSNKSNSRLGSNIEDVGSGKASKESGTTGFKDFENSSFIFQATKVKLSSENEQPGGKLDKETVEKLESVASVEQMSHLKPESQKANYSGERDINSSETNKLDDEMNQLNRKKGDGCQSFVKRPSSDVQESPVFKLSDEMKRWNINDSERTDGANYTKNLKDNLFVNVDTNFVFGSSQKTFGLSTEKDGVNNRKPRDKRSKEKLRRRTLPQRFVPQDNMSKGGSFQENDDTPGCCSPMDFSPYQTTDTAPSFAASESKDTTAGQGNDIKLSDTRSEESHSTCPGNNCESYFSGERSGNVSTSSSAQDGLSAIRHQYRKKYKLKVGNSSCRTSQSQKAAFTFSSAQSSPISCNPSRMKKAEKNLCKASEEHTKLGPADFVTDEGCENWRIRGNQAYKAGNLSKAEEFYTKGINSIPDTNVSEFYIQPLVLCYSNRAATRMSLGRIHDALGDCKMAATLDPSFLKVKLRAANCHLVLGEVEDAMLHYSNCLEPETHVCLDRRMTIEAADGLHKAQKVAEYMRQSVELLQQHSSDAANCALGIIAEALKISCYSEKLFEMKGEALCMLLMYDEVIQLCEQTLHIAEKNFTLHIAEKNFTLHIAEKNFTANQSANENDYKSQNSSSRLWRWRLMSKSHYHLGRLELALDLIEKQEQLISTVNESGSTSQESSSLAVAIRELLCHKKAGNEAFRSGRHAEAIENYTAAISKSVESRPFAAICFCNRAAAHQALGQLIDAIADCSLAIALDGNYLKAVSRRATLHEMIRDYEQAAYDIQRLVSLLENQSQEEQSDTHNRSGGSVKELQRARNRLSSVEKKVKKGLSLDLYLILGVKTSDTESDIKKAYRKAALRHHPDKAAQLLARNDVGDDGKLWKEIVEKVHKDADRLFKMIGEAYGVLSDPEKRLKYNDEEELREVLRNNNKSNHSGRPSDYYSSPSDRGGWSGRQSDSHGSPYGRSGNRQYWQEESWRGYSNSRSRW